MECAAARAVLSCFLEPEDIFLHGASPEAKHEPPQRPLFGKHKGREPLQRTPEIDRIHDLLCRESTYKKAARV